MQNHASLKIKIKNHWRLSRCCDTLVQRRSSAATSHTLVLHGFLTVKRRQLLSKHHSRTFYTPSRLPHEPVVALWILQTQSSETTSHDIAQFMMPYDRSNTLVYQNALCVYPTHLVQTVPQGRSSGCQAWIFPSRRPCTPRIIRCSDRSLMVYS